MPNYKCSLVEQQEICKTIMGDEFECPKDCAHIGADPNPVIGTVDDKWKIAQVKELEWWNRTFVNPFFEERKQILFAEKMGIPPNDIFQIDLEGRSVLDVGGGPVSLLLKCINGGRRTVVDPLDFPDWIKQRYVAAGIEFKQQAAEDMEEEGYDEVWLYNVLQHVKDPERVLEKAMKSAKILRIFEWIETGIDDMHLHSIHPSMIEKVTGQKGHNETIINVDGLLAKAFWGIMNCDKGSIVPSEVSHKPVPMMGPAKSGKMTFHIPGIPHTITNKDFLSCAYTQKVLKLSSMLTDLGHTVYHYGCEGSTVNCTEDVSVVTDEYRQKFYPNRSREEQFTYNIDDEFHHTFNRRIADEAKKRLGEQNFLLCAWGYGHKEISDFLGESFITCESGIGYADTFSQHRVFESYTWMHWIYGKQGSSDGGWYDAVIPNFFDPSDFEFKEEKQDWLLYIGRIVKRKGVELACQLAEKTGHKLVIAGQGTLKNEGEQIDLRGDHIDFQGYADVEKRKYLMANAKAVLVPTYYIEPFGGVAVEAMLSGTPVITTDWGVFSEHTLHNVTGYRCRTMEQFCWAVNNVKKLSPHACRKWAIDNYSMDRVAKMYDEYFSMLSDLWRGGWYEPRESRNNLDWLNRYYPTEAIFE